MNLTVWLSLLSALFFTASGAVLILRKNNTGLNAGLLTPLLLSILLYDFIVTSNFLEHSNTTDFLDPAEDIAEIVFTLIFLFFVNNWRKDRSEARFRELFKLAPMLLIEITRDGQIIQVNETFTRKVTELLGGSEVNIRSLNDLWQLAYPDSSQQKDSKLFWQQKLDQAFSSGAEVVSQEREIISVNGITHTMMVNAKKIGENLLVSMMDITDSKQEEVARIQNLELLRATFNTTPDGVLVLDRQQRTTHANQQFYNMWRVPEEFQTVGREKDLFSLILEQVEDPDGLKALVEKMPQSHSQTVYEIECKDGRVFKCYSVPMEIDNEEIGRVWDFNDISEWKRAEKEKEKLHDQLLQVQKLEAVGTLAGGVAHDFNNMLGAILGYTQITLKRMGPDNPYRSYLNKILDATHRSAGLTRQLLTFARKETVTREVLNLNMSVENMLKMLRRLIGENIQLDWQPAGYDCCVKMDPTQFDQIITNLCINARDAIADIGKITIQTERFAFDAVSCRPYVDCEPGNYIRLLVSDDGAGMDPETKEHAFDPFFTTKKMGQGTGLGLAMVYGIVKQNEGFINLYSEPGIGTSFNIYLPESTDQNVQSSVDHMDFSLPQGQGEAVLIAEDDPAIVEMCETMLEELGYIVLRATTPSEAIRLAETYEGEIHLLITDVIMPEMNGKELADRLLSIRPEVKVLFMSGYTADVIGDKGVLEKAGYFIQKPFPINELADKVHRILYE